MNLTNVIAISAGGHQSLALRSDGTVVQWGLTYSTAPTNANVEAIASGAWHHLALLDNGTVKGSGRELWKLEA